MSRPKWLQDYLDRGFRLVFYPHGEKGPRGVDAKGWDKRIYLPEEYKDGDNVGVMTGVEIQPGKFLVDADFDWPNGLPMVKRFFPPTEFGFGRASRPLSHAFFTTSEAMRTHTFDDLSGKPFLELRGTKVDGTLGFQTMVPPSVHPSGEHVEMRLSGEIGHHDNLYERGRLYAVACMLAQQLGNRGLLHDMRLHVAAFLYGLGIPEDDITAIGEEVAKLTGNDVSDVIVTVASTVGRIKRGERVASAGHINKALGNSKMVDRIREWFGGGQFVEEKGKIIANNQKNIMTAFDKLEVRLSFDTFCQKPKIVYNGYDGVLEDPIRNRIWLEIDSQFNFRPSADFFDVVLADAARSTPVHPVREYLSSLVWDQQPRLDKWLVTYGQAADTEYVRSISAIVLIAAVRRVMKPGCKFDELLVLESSQGLMKSTALKALVPDVSWFSDDLPLDVDAKQMIERTTGKWIIEAAELSGMRPSLVEHLKALLSRQVDGPVRMAYARLPVEQPRQFIVIGTTNSHTYLTDSTGNRRFWPVRVHKFDIKALIQDRDQLWAEAAAREAAGETIRLPERLYAHATIQQERRRTDDPWEERVATKFDEPFQRLPPDVIWEALGIPMERRNAEGQRRVNVIMQRLGFRRMTVKNRDGKVVKGWGRGEGQRDPVRLNLDDGGDSQNDDDLGM